MKPTVGTSWYNTQFLKKSLKENRDENLKLPTKKIGFIS